MKLEWESNATTCAIPVQADAPAIGGIVERIDAIRMQGNASIR